MFNCSVYDMVLRRKSKFLNKLQYSENTLCKMFRDFVKFELTELSVSHSYVFLVKLFFIYFIGFSLYQF